MTRTRPGILAELAFWGTPPLLFLVDYVLKSGAGWYAAAEHLRLVALLAVLVVLTRTLFLRNIAARGPVLALSALVSGTAMFLLCAYYLLVLRVFDAWGRVITTDVIAMYLVQARGLCDAMGIAFPVAVGTLAATWAGVVLGCWWWQRRGVWQPPVPAASPRLVDALLLALVLGCLNFLSYLPWTPSDAGEPVSLTLLSGQAGGKAYSISQGQTASAAIEQREAAVRQSYGAQALAARPNVILVVIDGLRADRMGVYGYARPTTPFLSGLASAGKLGIVKEARSVCSETTCGEAGIHAARYSHRMPRQPFTLHQALKRQGYTLHAILGNSHGHMLKAGLYGEVDDYFDVDMTRGAWYNSDDGALLERTRGLAAWNGRPAMLHYHLMAAHTLGTHYPKYQQFGPFERYAGISSGPPVPAYSNYYDGGVLQADAEIADIIRTLRDKAYLRDALLVITADHGESLGEHDKFAHTNSVYEQVLHIPFLLIRFRDGEAQPGRMYPGIRSQTDIGPTILHELGMAVPATWSGVPLGEADKRGFIFFQMQPAFGVYDLRTPGKVWKYWSNARTSEEFAFDVSADPAESHNLIKQVPPALLQSWRAQILLR